MYTLDNLFFVVLFNIEMGEGKISLSHNAFLKIVQVLFFKHFGVSSKIGF